MVHLQKIKKSETGFIGSRFLLAALLVFTVATVSAQEPKIVFSRQTLSVKEAIAEIRNQTDYYFAINHTRFDDSRVVYFPKQTLTLREALNRIVAETNHTYQIKNKQVLILVLEEAQPEELVKSEPVKSEPVKEPSVALKPLSPPLNKAYTPVLNDRFEQAIQDYTLSLKQDKRERKDTIAEKEVKEEGKDERLLPEAINTYTYPSQERALIYSKKKAENLRPEQMNQQPAMGMKVNVLYGVAAQAPNLALEFGLSRKTSLDLSVAWNPWGKDKADETDKMVHLIVKPEVRYWLCERFNGHFFGAHPFYWDYNVSGKKIPLLFDKEYRYEGNAFGVGVSYGYHWMWSKRWGMEANVGVGASFMKYKKFEAVECGDKLGNFKKKYFGPTSAGLKIMFMIK